MILNFKDIKISDIISIPIYCDNLIKNKKIFITINILLEFKIQSIY